MIFALYHITQSEDTFIQILCRFPLHLIVGDTFTLVYVCMLVLAYDFLHLIQPDIDYILI